MYMHTHTCNSAEEGQTSFYKQARAALEALRQASEMAQRLVRVYVRLSVMCAFPG